MLRLDLWPNSWSIKENVFTCWWGECVIVELVVKRSSNIFIFSVVCLNSNEYLLIFMSIAGSGALKSLTLTALEALSRSNAVCCLYTWAVLHWLHMYVFFLSRNFYQNIKLLSLFTHFIWYIYLILELICPFGALPFILCSFVKWVACRQLLLGSWFSFDPFS